MASATNNNTVVLWQLDAERCSKNWNAETCQPQWIGAPLTGSESAVDNVVFLSDSKLVSSSSNGQIILWNLDKTVWYDQACRVVNRTLTDTEYSQHIEGKINRTLLGALKWINNNFRNTPDQVVPECVRSK